MTNSNGFNFRDSNSRKRLGFGLGAAIIAALSSMPTSRDVVKNIGDKAYGTVLDTKTSLKHGDAGTLLYSATKVKLGEMTFGRDTTVADYAQRYDDKDYPGLSNLVAEYLMKANNIPSLDSIIKADQIVSVPYYDPEYGRRFGDLIDQTSKPPPQ